MALPTPDEMLAEAETEINRASATVSEVVAAASVVWGRIERGRGLHAVDQTHKYTRYSRCRKPHPVKGVSSTVARAAGPPEVWRFDDPPGFYPRCRYCEKVATQ